MLNTIETRKMVRAFAEAQGVALRNASWTNRAKDSNKRNLGFEMLFGTKFTDSDCAYLKWMTGCKTVRTSTSEQGYNYVRLLGVQFN
tara:strand:- start:231 stop:491 length:261 start_codon:yes stop_codon:yes gene_type:complete